MRKHILLLLIFRLSVLLIVGRFFSDETQPLPSVPSVLLPRLLAVRWEDLSEEAKVLVPLREAQETTGDPPCSTRLLRLSSFPRRSPRAGCS